MSSPTNTELLRGLDELQDSPTDRWFRYLRSLPARNLARPQAAAAAERLWERLTEEIASLTPPNASPTDDGGVLMSWMEHGYHVEIEVMPSGAYEWFYRHRESDTTDGGSVEDETVSSQLVTYLGRVLT